MTAKAFETAIGWCGVAWSERGICRARLPEPSAEETRERLKRRVPEAEEIDPPADIRDVIEKIRALLAGEPVDLSAVALDLEGVAPFNLRVYEIAKAIPAGSTMTYGEIAERLGERNAARAVGQALGENPIPIIIPCHRVLGAGGKFGGFSAPGGLKTKARLLTIEGAQTSAAPSLFERLPLSAPPRKPMN
jgi:methylated-DNA-[protein]-cysteine S-methyltransferase